MTAKSEQKELTHQRILASASRIVRERGIIGARVADVMQAVQLTVGGFYRHFGSKTELVDAALRQAGEKLRHRLFANLDDQPPADRAAVILQRYLSPSHRDLQNDGCSLPAIVGDIASAAPEHRAALNGELEALAAGLAEQLNGAPSLPRRQLVLGLIALMYGGLSLARALRGTALSDELLQACRAVGTVVAR
jgi:TetR/AcrR family transcriptional repressor of nem operon